jgi:DNA-binding response OmpR family regulator
MTSKILVTDDEEITRRSLADILRLEGYFVATAADGAAALEALRRERFDLLLLDLKMPGIDGLEVMRAAAGLAPDTQIIMLTAHGSLESAIEALRADAFDYLLKPSSPEQIVQSVAAALKRRAETQRKRSLLDALEGSLRELRHVEIPSAVTFRGTESPISDPLVLALGGGVMFDLQRREVWQSADGLSPDAPTRPRVSLTPAEGRLLQVLYENRGRVIPYKELVAMVQGYEVTDWEAPEVLRPLVSRLRQKLSCFPGGKEWIASVRGSGYVLEIP